MVLCPNEQTCFVQMEDVKIPILRGSMDDVGDEEVSGKENGGRQ